MLYWARNCVLNNYRVLWMSLIERLHCIHIHVPADYCNSQTYSCSVYTLTTCVHVTHLGIISFPGNASNGCDGVKAGMLIFSANTAIGFTALF